MPPYQTHDLDAALTRLIHGRELGSMDLLALVRFYEILPEGTQQLALEYCREYAPAHLHLVER